MRKIVICPKCGFIGSVDPAEGIGPCCPNCEAPMTDTGIDREQWAQKTAEEQKAVKAACMPAPQPAPRPAAPAASKPADDALARMAKDVHSLKKWVKAWTIVFLVLMLLIFIIAIEY